MMDSACGITGHANNLVEPICLLFFIMWVGGLFADGLFVCCLFVSLLFVFVYFFTS